MGTKTDSLEMIRQEVLTCPKCRLALTRRNAVPGEGATDTRFVFVGEAPGRHEDEMGRPFVGIGGSFLNEILAKFEIDRSKIFITSVNKCHPLRNRRPKPDEIKSCLPYLWRQIALLDPALIVLLGDVALKSVLKVEPHGLTSVAPPPTSSGGTLRSVPSFPSSVAVLLRRTGAKATEGYPSRIHPRTSVRGFLRRRVKGSLAELRGSIIFWEGREIIPTYHPNAALRFPKARSLMEKDLALVVEELKRMGLWDKVRTRQGSRSQGA